MSFLLKDVASFERYSRQILFSGIGESGQHGTSRIHRRHNYSDRRHHHGSLMSVSRLFSKDNDHETGPT